MLILCLIGLQSVFAQSREVTGVVTSADDGLSIPGVSVIIKGTTIGTTTDFDGKYTISVPADAKVLQFSFVGMKYVEMPITSNTINVVMESETVGMDEVVVMGYTVRKKNELTGSTVQISGEALEEVPVASIDQALQGRIAGVTISASSGTPGSVQNIRIRGVSSITAGNEPLYVIDGVPVINDDIAGDGDVSSTLTPLAALNSNNIESITVLKDASATSAYGARGSNGVIVITTKTGKSGKTQFNFSSTVGWSNNAVDGYDVLSGAQWSELYEEATGSDSEWDGTDTDWASLTQNKDALMQTYDFSARGGDEKNTFFASLGYNNTEGTTIGTDFERLSAQLNVTRKFSDKIKFSTRNAGSTLTQNGTLEQSAYFSSPNLTKYFMASRHKAFDDEGNYYLDNPTSLANTLYTTEHNINENVVTRIMSNNSLSAEIIKNLTFKSTFAVDYTIADYKQYNNRHHGDSDDTGGYLYESNTQIFNWVTQNSLNYKFFVNEDHKFDVTLIQEYQKNKRNELGAEGEKFPADGLLTLNTAGNPLAVYGEYSDWAISSYLGLLNYSFASKYFLDVTVRREGSSRFPTDEMFGTFWSVGGAWNVSEETFMEDFDFLSNLRLRASYGTNGSAAVDNNSHQALLSYDANYNGSGASYPSQFGNRNLTWEKNDIVDLGMEFGLFSNRLTGSAGYYHRKTYDLLLDVPLPLITGHDEQSKNVGEMTNKGLEFELNADIINTENFKWSLGFNLATVDNEVTKMAKDNSGNALNIETGTRKVEEGHAVYSWNMRKYAGVDTQTGNPLWYLDGKGGETTNDYSAAEKAYQGASALPTYSGGVNTHLEYKGIYLDASIYFAGGHKVYEDWAFYTHHSYYPLFYYQGVDKLMDRWQNPGDVTDVPRVGTDAELADASSASTRFLYDGDYVRLKDIVLGYKFPESVTSKLGCNSIRAFVKGTNLLTWVKDDNLVYDPEVQATGFTKLATPPTKSFIIGFNINF